MGWIQEQNKKKIGQNTTWTDKTPVVIKKDIPLKRIVPINVMAIPFKFNWQSNLEKNIRYIGLQVPTVVLYDTQKTYELLSSYFYIQDAMDARRDSIQAFVIEEFTDEAALQIIIKSHPTQLDFKDWTYTQKIRLIKICDRYIREHSQQGKRTDLEDISTCDQNKDGALQDGLTCVQNINNELQDALTCDQSDSKPELADKSGRLYIRNVIAGQLGISPTVLKRFRQISKLDDDTVDVLSKGVDDGRVDSTAVHRIAQLKQGERAAIMELMKSNAGIKIKDRDLKLIYDKSKVSENDLTAEIIKDVLMP